MDCFQQKKKKRNPTASGLSLHISCHRVMWVAVLARGGGGGSRRHTGALFTPRPENDKFNKLKTPLRSTYGIKHT